MTPAKIFGSVTRENGKETLSAGEIDVFSGQQVDSDAFDFLPRRASVYSIPLPALFSPRTVVDLPREVGAVRIKSGLDISDDNAVIVSRESEEPGKSEERMTVILQESGQTLSFFTTEKGEDGKEVKTTVRITNVDDVIRRAT